MPKDAAQTTRILTVTAGNLRNSHLYVRDHYDFFPADCVGPPRQSRSAAHEIEIELDGLGETVRTDLGADAKTGRPRGFFRGRRWVRKFFAHHAVGAGDKLALERSAERRYRLRVESRATQARPGLTAGEFFAGIGLVRLALQRCGIRIVFANDIDADKYAMYRDNFGASDFVLGDVHALAPESVPTCDLFTASFPCNDLSIAGAMNGIHSGQSSAFWGFLEVVRGLGERRPRMILLENVPGFLMANGGRDFAAAIAGLNDLGYAADAVFVDAAWFVPQSRLRLFVIAERQTESEYPFGLQPSELRPRALVDFVLGHPELHWRIADLPAPPKSTAKLRDVLEDLPEDDPAWWDAERRDYFCNQLSARHAEIARKMIAGRTYSYGTAFRRVRHGRSMAELRVDGLAGCLRTPRGGSGRQILFKAGRGKRQVRLLSARECARLQGVPDSYRIDATLNKALFGFGDAVCVPAVEWLVKHAVLPRIAEEHRLSLGNATP